ncbi:Dam family site-specific DNA-(adenine-N6)-methyltransferase [Citrobacter freundii]|uniref:Dam family site-specific DNA-(adenine-N6)-methyltransferase n=1 Tax=Citrobacter freundii complex sp. 2022EL-00972 TaxID=2994609 RepID=UPI002247E6A2|nr:Dam family site-specific DNA-(adenine-N6)-methyltransferase [Citrobacter freundii complex sp. 2022EL-00972]MCX2461388.1 Dam family site-specific DNA-(adenine-N6)-methyltransferase [Citrobacter freundii complex sp. 2022EL-00972]
MRYGSVCSGIEAASVAWESLGWQPAWFAEIEAFPSAVLAHHWPDVANLGDMTKIAAAVRAGDVAAPDVLVGGTPCQAFSIAGLRNGLDDERGQLTLSYVELANAIDDKRRERGEDEAIIVWENVPGVLSSKDNAFGCFLAGLAGESSELQPAGGKWTHAGCVYGPQRIIAWRVLDAQFFGVAQRRRRVFVVASSRKDVDPAAVLFEFNSMRRNTPPCRETQPEVASHAGKRPDGGSHWDHPANPHPTLNQSNNIGGIGASNQEIFSQRGSGIVGAYRMTAFGEYADDETASTVKARDYKDATDLAVTYSNVSRTLLAKSNDSMAEDLETYAVHGTQDPDTNHELAHTLGRNHGQENAVCYGFKPGQGSKAGGIGWAEELSPTLTSAQSGTNLTPAIAFAENSRGEIRLQGGDGQITGPLSTGGGKPGQGFPAIAFSYKDHGADATVDMSPTLRDGNHDTSHANSGQPPAICIQHASIGRHDAAGPQGKGYQEDVAFTQDSRSSADVVQYGMQVRRLTPVECERLQGFPDNHTMISWRGKDADECPDGPRYKAIGNSMAVPVMRWIGERIAAALPVEAPAPRNWQRPFLKWAGGKYSLLPELDRLIPAGKRLIEPFVGGGSVFLNSDKHERFLLADVNADLINLYQMLAVVPDSVIYEAMKAFRHLNDAENYTEIREAFNAQRLDAVERAAAFLYLNRHCFNGLIRYNLDGFFNVGFGKYKAPYFPEEEIKAFKRKAHSCVFMNAGFRRTLTLAGDGDVVYCDPPYEPLPGTAGFTNYAAGGFSWDSQVELTESCVAAHQRGAKVAISNSTAPRVIELYEQHGFTLHRVSARRAISSKGSTRETASDVVATLGVK